MTTKARLMAGGLAAGLLAVVAALSLTVSGDPAGGWEQAVVERSAAVTDVVGLPARGVMQLGNVEAVVPVALVAWWVVARWQVPVAVVTAGVVAWAVTNRLKEWVERPRPDESLWRESPGTWGYPSGHTSTAFALAIVVAVLVPPRWRWVPLAAATIVAVTRMHVGVHYPLDLVGGALIGTAAGLLAIAALDPARATAPVPEPATPTPAS
jgi:membrane-associated phospholipid phosphatase